jgi:Predicted membrane protein
MPFFEVENQHDAFMQRSRLWVFCGAASLAMTAGYVNVVMLGFFAVPVSHMSGAVSQLGISLAGVGFDEVFLIASIVIGFFCGAFLSGIVLGETSFKMRRRYGLLLLIESGLLAAAMLLALTSLKFTVPVAAMACGLQNAMASSYRGLTLRTTHVTGIVTDLGALLGNRLRGRQVKRWKFGLLLSTLIAFFIGGLGGALFLKAMGMWSLSLACGLCLILGIVVFLISDETQVDPSS